MADDPRRKGQGQMGANDLRSLVDQSRTDFANRQPPEIHRDLDRPSSFAEAAGSLLHADNGREVVPAAGPGICVSITPPCTGRSAFLNGQE
jgi:hypothetical protein